LVILDVQMPVLDGFAACTEIRQGERGDEIPIVIVTGTDDTDSIERAFEAGATDFISKPVNWSLLGHRMRYILRSAETRHSLREREAENSALLEAVPDRLVLVKKTGEIVKLLEQDKKQAPERNYTGDKIDVLLPHEVVPVAKRILVEVLTNQAEGVFEFQLKPDLDKHHYEARVVPQTRGVALMIIREVTQKKEADARIHQLAYYDTLTKLPNRHYFMQVIANVLSPKTDQRFALISMNLDQFKRINDTLGHATGDAVLMEFANRLVNVKKSLRDSGRYADLARLSGDEFVFLTALRGESHLREIMQLIDKELNAPFDSNQQQIIVTTSIGVTTYPEDSDSIHTLLTQAAQALAASKRAGGNTHSLYRYVKQDLPTDLLKLEFELRSAIQNNDLELFFQPKYNLTDGTLYGAEALLRWFHPDRGPIAPSVFIPLAEQSGLIVDIDRWVIERACKYLDEWQLAGRNVVPISINLSGRAFSYDRPTEAIAKALAEYKIDPSLVEVEITETVLMADAEQATKTLVALKSMGIRLAIDDFGTGYSSLSYLKRFPLDVLKIDRAFIEDLETDNNDRALCQAMISMGHSLGLEVVAEGIETEFQLGFLTDAGCELAQGFLLDKPMSAAHFERKIDQPVRRFALNRPETQAPPPKPMPRH
jgi:diguanylate cyclase (GGDEF)-like protein